MRELVDLTPCPLESFRHGVALGSALGAFDIYLLRLFGECGLATLQRDALVAHRGRGALTQQCFALRTETLRACRGGDRLPLGECALGLRESPRRSSRRLFGAARLDIQAFEPSAQRGDLRGDRGERGRGARVLLRDRGEPRAQ